jgi:hypothetical protein
MIHQATRWAFCPGLALLMLASAAPVLAADGVRIEQQDGKLRIQIDGELFSEYRYADGSRPYLYPILGPGGVRMTRHWPMEQAPDEEHDHPHHRSFWFGHGDVNGHDFWSEEPKAGRTVHDKFLEIRSGPDEGVIRSANKCVAQDGTVVCTDERTLRIHRVSDARLMDFEIVIQAGDKDLVFGDTKEGTMAVRLAETMRLKGKVGKGRIVNSEGLRDDATWGKRARWVDYSGPVSGQEVGLAMFDHPKNPRHPTWWHVRDYGLFAANPFGVHDFEKKPAGAGNLAVKAGETLTFRYRFYFHRGDAAAGRVAERYEAYVRGAK